LARIAPPVERRRRTRASASTGYVSLDDRVPSLHSIVAKLAIVARLAGPAVGKPVEHGRSTFRVRRNRVAYHFLVCFDRLNDVLDRSAGPSEGSGPIDPRILPIATSPDLHALETALLARDEHAIRVTAIALRPPHSCEALREALYRGADRAILVTDPRSSGADSLATAYVLACAVRKLAPDVVVFGARSAYGDAAHVGVQVAEKAGLTPVTRVDRPIEVDGNTITARRDTGAGWEVVSARTPVLLTVMDTANTPRPPAMKRMMKYKRAMSRPEVEDAVERETPAIAGGLLVAEVERRLLALANKGLSIETWSLDDIGADPSKCGSAGSPTRLERVQSYALSGRGSRRFENSDEGLARLVAELLRDHTI